MIIKIIIALVVLLVLRDILALLFGWYSDEPGMSLGEFLSNVSHNAAIDRKWREDGKPIVTTTVGWRRDPFGKQDGYRKNYDGSYSKLIRGGTEKYREQFARDVERSKRENT